VPVIERPELPGIPFGLLDELSLLVAGRVTHWPFSLCRFKREVLEAGYEFASSKIWIIKRCA
jgi:hypothetical protein